MQPRPDPLIRNHGSHDHGHGHGRHHGRDEGDGSRGRGAPLDGVTARMGLAAEAIASGRPAEPTAPKSQDSKK